MSELEIALSQWFLWTRSLNTKHQTLNWITIYYLPMHAMQWYHFQDFQFYFQQFSLLIRPQDFVTWWIFFSIVICAICAHRYTMVLMHFRCIEPGFHCIWCRELEDFEQNHSIWLTQCGIWHTNFSVPSIHRFYLVLFTTYPRDFTILRTYRLHLEQWLHYILFPFFFEIV